MNSQYQKLRDDLGVLGRELPREFRLRDLEKWMCGVLGVKRISQKGSHVIYVHEMLKSEMNSVGHLSVPLIHGRKVEMVYRINFQRHIIEKLRIIIDAMEMEDTGSGEES